MASSSPASRPWLALVGAVVEESQQRGIVEVASVDVVADVDADVSDRHRP